MTQPTLDEMFANPNEKRGLNGCNKEMNRIFSEWLADHVTENSGRGELARKVRDKGLKHTDSTFPRWSDYESLS